MIVKERSFGNVVMHISSTAKYSATSPTSATKLDVGLCLCGFLEWHMEESSATRVPLISWEGLGLPPEGGR